MSKKQTTTTTGIQPKRTPSEQQILTMMVELEGREFVEQNAELILEQARQLGELEVPELKTDDKRTVDGLKKVMDAVKKTGDKP